MATGSDGGKRAVAGADRPTQAPGVPRKIRQLLRDHEQAGFNHVSGGKGSHRKYVHPKLPGFVLVSGHGGDDAKPYLEKQARNAIRRIQS